MIEWVTIILWMALGCASYSIVKNTIENDFFENIEIEFNPIACAVFIYCGFISAVVSLMIYAAFRDNKKEIK